MRINSSCGPSILIVKQNVLNKDIFISLIQNSIRKTEVNVCEFYKQTCLFCTKYYTCYKPTTNNMNTIDIICPLETKEFLSLGSTYVTPSHGCLLPTHHNIKTGLHGHNSRVQCFPCSLTFPARSCRVNSGLNIRCCVDTVYHCESSNEVKSCYPKLLWDNNYCLLLQVILP